MPPRPNLPPLAPNPVDLKPSRAPPATARRRAARPPRRHGCRGPYRSIRTGTFPTIPRESSAQEDLIIQGSVEGSDHAHAEPDGGDRWHHEGRHSSALPSLPTARSRAICMPPNQSIFVPLQRSRAMSSRRASASSKAHFFRARSKCSHPARPYKSTVFACVRRRWRRPWTVPPSIKCWDRARRRAKAGSALRQEQFGIYPGAIEAQAPVQMGPGRAPGHSDGSDASSRGKALSRLHVDDVPKRQNSMLIRPRP